MELLYHLAEVLRGIPDWLATMLLATLPIGELRGALPVAITVYKMPLLWAVFFSILGNLIPVYFLLIFFERGATFARRISPHADRFLDALFERTRRKLHYKVEKYGPWALAIFVAIPLPVTGAWTGTLAAFVFGLPKRKAFLAITLGLIIAAVIVATLTVTTSFGINKIRG